MAADALAGVHASRRWGGVRARRRPQRRPGTYLGEDIIEAAEILERVLADAA